MKSFFKLIRLPNLIIVALTQILLQFAIIKPALKSLDIAATLSDFDFFIFILANIIVTAGGYIINDIKDQEIDRINKSIEKQLVGRVISEQKARIFYIISLILGGFLSIYLVFFTAFWLQAIIFPVATFLLFAYARWFKKMNLIGNILVAALCAFVAIEIWLLQDFGRLPCTSNTIADKGFLFTKYCYRLQNHLYYIIINYTTFAFFSTLFREIIKDIEDIEGDRAVGCHTLPIAVGIEDAKYLAGFVLAVFMIVVVVSGSIFLDVPLVEGSKNDIWKFYILALTILLPSAYIFYFLTKAKEKKDFTFISKAAKGLMLGGLIFILVIII